MKKKKTELWNKMFINIRCIGICRRLGITASWRHFQSLPNGINVECLLKIFTKNLISYTYISLAN